MDSKPPQTRKGTQGFPFQTLPLRPERVWRKAAQTRLQKECSRVSDTGMKKSNGASADWAQMRYD